MIVACLSTASKTGVNFKVDMDKLCIPEESEHLCVCVHAMTRSAIKISNMMKTLENVLGCVRRAARTETWDSILLTPSSDRHCQISFGDPTLC